MEMNQNFISDIIEHSEEVKDLRELISSLLTYASHKSDCDLVLRGRMHPIAAQTMDDVVGPAVCNCGLAEMRKRAQEVI